MNRIVETLVLASLRAIEDGLPMSQHRRYAMARSATPDPTGEVPAMTTTPRMERADVVHQVASIDARIAELAAARRWAKAHPPKRTEPELEAAAESLYWRRVDACLDSRSAATRSAAR